MKAIINYIKNVMSIIGKYKKDIRKGYIAAFFEASFSFIPYMILFYIISVYIKRKIEIKDVFIVTTAMLISVIFRIFCKRAQDRLQQNRGLYALTEKRLDIANFLASLPMGYYTERNIGNVTSIISTDLSFIEEFVFMQLGLAISALINWIVSAIFVFLFHMKLGFIYIFISILGVLALKCMHHAMEFGARTRQDNFAYLSQSVIDFTRGLPTIKAFNMIREKNTDMEETVEKVQKDSLDFVKYGRRYLSFYQILTNIPTGLFIIAILLLMKSGGISIEFGIGFIVFSFVLFSPIILLGSSMEILSVANASVNRYKELFKEKPIKNSYSNKKIEKMDIEFQNVSFSYGNYKVLKDINLKIKPKTFTALIGHSGSGKTTIANLIARFWDVDRGKITINDIDIKKYSLEELMKNISMVFQEVFLFNDTIYNNIAFGNDDVTREEVIEVAKKARAHDFIMKFPRGYDTIIGEGGSSLSGGEKQRISIARAMLKNAKLVLLDEATAGIDPDNEKFIQEAIKNLVKDKTLIVIAHRLSTIQNADQIVVMENGRIVEIGTSEELISKNGIYKKQFDYYKKIKEN